METLLETFIPFERFFPKAQAFWWCFWQRKPKPFGGVFGNESPLPAQTFWRVLGSAHCAILGHHCWTQWKEIIFHTNNTLSFS